MYKTLRIVFCCLSVACVAAAVFVFMYAQPWQWGFMVVAAAAVFFFIMTHFKRKQEAQELEKNPPPPIGDFITGRIPEQCDDSGADEANGATDGDANDEAGDRTNGGAKDEADSKTKN